MPDCKLDDNVFTAGKGGGKLKQYTMEMMDKVGGGVTYRELLSKWQTPDQWYAQFKKGFPDVRMRKPGQQWKKIIKCIDNAANEGDDKSARFLHENYTGTHVPFPTRSFAHNKAGIKPRRPPPDSTDKGDFKDPDDGKYVAGVDGVVEGPATGGITAPDAPHCGPFNKIGTKVSGKLDAACRKHDACYGEREKKGKGAYLTHNKCDDVFLEDLKGIPGVTATIARTLFNAKKRWAKHDTDDTDDGAGGAGGDTTTGDGGGDATAHKPAIGVGGGGNGQPQRSGVSKSGGLPSLDRVRDVIDAGRDGYATGRAVAKGINKVGDVYKAITRGSVDGGTVAETEPLLGEAASSSSVFENVALGQYAEAAEGLGVPAEVIEAAGVIGGAAGEGAEVGAILGPEGSAALGTIAATGAAIYEGFDLIKDFVHSGKKKRKDPPPDQSTAPHNNQAVRGGRVESSRGHHPFHVPDNPSIPTAGPHTNDAVANSHVAATNMFKETEEIIENSMKNNPAPTFDWAHAPSAAGAQYNDEHPDPVSASGRERNRGVQTHGAGERKHVDPNAGTVPPPTGEDVPNNPGGAPPGVNVEDVKIPDNNVRVLPNRDDRSNLTFPQEAPKEDELYEDLHFRALLPIANDDALVRPVGSAQRHKEEFVLFDFHQRDSEFESIGDKLDDDFYRQRLREDRIRFKSPTNVLPLRFKGSADGLRPGDEKRGGYGTQPEKPRTRHFKRQKLLNDNKGLVYKSALGTLYRKKIHNDNKWKFVATGEGNELISNPIDGTMHDQMRENINFGKDQMINVNPTAPIHQKTMFDVPVQNPFDATLYNHPHRDRWNTLVTLGTYPWVIS
jgi:hypothetical protein